MRDFRIFLEKSMNKVFKAASIGLFGLAAMNANAGIASVGGVTWDASAATDFNAGYDFQQWFVDANGEWVNPDDLKTGDILLGVGEFYSINNSFDFLCSGCELTVSFSGLSAIVDEISEEYDTIAAANARADELAALGYRNITSTFGGSGLILTADRNGFDTSGSEFVIYTDRELNEVSGETNFSEGELASTTTLADALAELNQARDGDVWISGKLGTTSLTDGSLFDSGTIEYYVTFENPLDMAYKNFVQDIFVDPVSGAFMDAFGSGEASIDNQDAISITDSDGNLVFATFSGAGTINADSISEPSTLAAMGLALLGFGVIRRRKKY